MSLESLLYTLSSKYILTICLSNTNNRNSTLDYVFNNSRMTGSTYCTFLYVPTQNHVLYYSFFIASS